MSSLFYLSVNPSLLHKFTKLPCLVHFFSQSSNFDPPKISRAQFNTGLECEFLHASDGSLLGLGVTFPSQEVTGTSGAYVKLYTSCIH